MGRANHALHRGQTLTPEQNTDVTLHVWIGFAVLAAALVRLALRVRFGAPPAPADEGRLVQVLGRLSHHAFYVLLVVVPVTGIVAYYWLPALGDVHSLGKPA